MSGLQPVCNGLSSHCEPAQQPLILFNAASIPMHGPVALLADQLQLSAAVQAIILMHLCCFLCRLSALLFPPKQPCRCHVLQVINIVCQNRGHSHFDLEECTAACNERATVQGINLAKLDAQRCARMFSFGLLFYGPYQHWWYRALDRTWGAKTTGNFVTKVGRPVSSCTGLQGRSQPVASSP